MNDNQNHNIREGRTTSRVLAPPGGRSTLTIGLDPALVHKTKKVEAQAPQPSNTEQTNEKEQVPSTIPAAPKTTQSSEKAVSANAFAAGSNMNGAQVMTGRPTSRVLYPGGGGGPTQWTLG